MGSASELEYHLLLSHDLSIMTDADYTSLMADTVEVKRMLASLIVSLQRSSPSNPHRPLD